METIAKELEETKNFCEEIQKEWVEGEEGDSQDVRKLKKKIKMLTSKTSQQEISY